MSFKDIATVAILGTTLALHPIRAYDSAKTLFQKVGQGKSAATAICEKLFEDVQGGETRVLIPPYAIAWELASLGQEAAIRTFGYFHGLDDRVYMVESDGTSLEEQHTLGIRQELIPLPNALDLLEIKPRTLVRIVHNGIFTECKEVTAPLVTQNQTNTYSR